MAARYSKNAGSVVLGKLPRRNSMSATTKPNIHGKFDLMNEYGPDGVNLKECSSRRHSSSPANTVYSPSNGFLRKVRSKVAGSSLNNKKSKRHNCLNIPKNKYIPMFFDMVSHAGLRKNDSDYLLRIHFAPKRGVESTQCLTNCFPAFQ